MNWNQPCCEICWECNNPRREALRLVTSARSVERCAWCGVRTRSGIYVRTNPHLVPFPAQ